MYTDVYMCCFIHSPVAVILFYIDIFSVCVQFELLKAALLSAETFRKIYANIFNKIANDEEKRTEQRIKEKKNETPGGERRAKRGRRKRKRKRERKIVKLLTIMYIPLWLMRST